MPKKKNDLSAILGRRAAAATKALTRLDVAREAESLVERDVGAVPTPLEQIGPRASIDTRGLSPDHVVALAESVAALGLLQPLVLDKSSRLLAGGHRLAALKILRVEPHQRGDELLRLTGSERLNSTLLHRLQAVEVSPSLVTTLNNPVCIRERFDSSLEPEAALAVEAAENAVRRQYTPAQVLQVHERLLELGFTSRRGRPRRGERPVRPAVAAVLGLSIKTVERSLARAREETPPRHVMISKRILRDLKLLTSLRDELPEDFRIATTNLEETGFVKQLAKALEKSDRK